MITLEQENIIECFTASRKREVRLWLRKEEDNPLTKISQEDADEIIGNFPELAKIQVKRGTNMEIYIGLKSETTSVVNFPALEIIFADEKRFDRSTIFTTIFIEDEGNIREFFDGLVHS